MYFEMHPLLMHTSADPDAVPKRHEDATLLKKVSMIIESAASQATIMYTVTMISGMLAPLLCIVPYTFALNSGMTRSSAFVTVVGVASVLITALLYIIPHPRVKDAMRELSTAVGDYRTDTIAPVAQSQRHMAAMQHIAELENKTHSKLSTEAYLRGVVVAITLIDPFVFAVYASQFDYSPLLLAGIAVWVFVSVIMLWRKWGTSADSKYS